MKIFYIDTEGWGYCENTPSDAGNACEMIDIENNEYTVIDQDGYLYHWAPSTKTSSGYIPVKSEDTNQELLQQILDQNTDAGFRINKI